MNTTPIPTISNADAASRNLSGRTREERPTYGELLLQAELIKVKEEALLLRAALKGSHETIRDLADIAGCPEVAEDLYTPDRSF